MAWVMIFIAVSYSSSLNFSMKKPFNPLLGETFELIDEKAGIKIIGE
jgi:hypothetical protein